LRRQEVAGGELLDHAALAYITSTRSQNRATRRRSWLMKISPMPRSRTRSSRIAQHLGLHGDVQRRGRFVGDQQVGLGISIIAIITRWPMPPDSSCG
jgi:hypothetical protein